MGGDEFFVAARLPRLMAGLVADRYCTALDFRMAWEGGVLDVHVSVGFAVSGGESPAELIAAADRAMYEQKRSQVTAVVR